MMDRKNWLWVMAGMGLLLPGMAQALGASLQDEKGRELPPGGAALLNLHSIQWNPDVLHGVQVEAACDVGNVLCGASGASAVYGPQKGADPEQVALLDRALQHYAEVLLSDLGKDAALMPGAGAAGGMGAGLLAFCNASLLPGAELTLGVCGFDAACMEADLVLTGEGRLDSQTAHGKLIAAVCRRAKNLGKPVIALAGSIEEGAEDALRDLGLSVAFGITEGPVSLEEAMRTAPRLLQNAAERAIRTAFLTENCLSV